MERDNLMHGARTALNRDPEIRAWCEEFLKQKHRAINSAMTDEEYEKYWRYHKPEIMHEGAAEAIQAYKTREK
jgi:cyclopropane fatty-acyl-phospholipid synthase-like methyltransferase